METPKTQSGFLTEKIMERIVRKWAPMGKIPVEQYNRIYSSILEVLTETLEPPTVIKRTTVF